RWYRGLVDIRLEVLEVVPPSESPKEHERWWIQELEREGHPLINIRLRGGPPPPRRAARSPAPNLVRQVMYREECLDLAAPGVAELLAAELRDLGIID